MRKYLIIDEYSLPNKHQKAYTRFKVVESDHAISALSYSAYENYISENKWDKAVRSGALDMGTVAIYELTTGDNLLEKIAKGAGA